MNEENCIHCIDDRLHPCIEEKAPLLIDGQLTIVQFCVWLSLKDKFTVVGSCLWFKLKR